MRIYTRNATAATASLHNKRVLQRKASQPASLSIILISVFFFSFCRRVTEIRGSIWISDKEKKDGRESGREENEGERERAVGVAVGPAELK